MDPKADSYIWKETSKEDINTTKFLELLRKYNYEWYQNDGETTLNLTTRDKRLFLKECRDTIEDVDEIRASLIIDIIRHMFMEELFRLQKGPKNSQLPPWFFQAYLLFQQTSISEDTSITNPPVSVPTSKITDALTSATVSSLPSSPTVEQLPWLSVVPHWELPSLCHEIQLSNSSSLSLKDDHGNENFLRNVNSQNGCPILYPVSILPCASQGRYGVGSGIFRSRNERESISGVGISINMPSSAHPLISDSSCLSVNDGIPNPANSYRPDSRHSEITNQDRNYLQSVTSIIPIEPIVTGFTANNYSAEKCENFTNNFSSHVPFQSSTARTSTSSVLSAMLSASSSNGNKISSLLRGRSKVCNSPTATTKSFTLLPPKDSLLTPVTTSVSSFTSTSTPKFTNSATIQSSTARASTSPLLRAMLSASFGTGNKISSLPCGRSKVRNSPTARTKSSSLLPPKDSLLPPVTTSISSFTSTFTPTFTNSVTFQSSAARASISPLLRAMLSASSGTGNKISSLPCSRSKVRNSTTARTKSSTLLPPKDSLLPPVRTSVSSFTSTSTPTFTNSATFQSSTAKASTSPLLRAMLSASSGTGNKISSLPRGRSKVRNSPSARTKTSTLLPPKDSFSPPVTTSVSSFTSTSTPMFSNIVFNPSFSRASIPPASRVPISQAYRNIALTICTNSISHSVNWPHQLDVNSAFSSSATVQSEETILSSVTNTAPVKQPRSNLSVESKMIKSAEIAVATD